MAPVTYSDRIISLDILRGFAILGILIMNIISFAMPGAHYMNPMAEGALQGADKWTFYFSQLFANQKFISLFAILFGAGILLMSERMESLGKSSSKRHYTRNFWLLLIGLFHAYVIWHGDVLVSYAICAIWVYWFRKKSARTLFVLGGIFMLISFLMWLLTGVSIPYIPEESLAEMCAEWTPTEAAIAEEIATFRGDWSTHFPLRAEFAFGMQFFLFFYGVGWQVTGLMLIGMGLYKTRIITADREPSFYKKMIWIGLSIGLLLGLIGLYQNELHNWACDYSFFLGSQWNYLASLPMALGYIGIVMLLCESKWVDRLKTWIAPIGRMALTNYLMQSIIATFLFYGTGLGLFGTVGRAEQWIYILGIWGFQLFFSRWWLSRFRFGPMEWFWRSLTYWKLQPMK